MKPSTTELASLPTFILQRVFVFVPVQDRLRLVLVCRAWLELLAERRLWLHLDMSDQGVRVYLLNRSLFQADALLRCAAARAGGALASLRLDTNYHSREALFDVVTANADTLEELHLSNSAGSGHTLQSTEPVEKLLRAAPQLRLFIIDGYFYITSTLLLHCAGCCKRAVASSAAVHSARRV
jgi:hypothetical protein